MESSPTLQLDYVECPCCGARFVVRDPAAVAHGPESRPRWFSCWRCKKRVKSAGPGAREQVRAS